VLRGSKHGRVDEADLVVCCVGNRLFGIVLLHSAPKRIENEASVQAVLRTEIRDNDSTPSKSRLCVR
jgi:hypothetical protein